MLTYNTRLKPLRLPEYGRNIQRMVDLCLEIEDRDERTACAVSIVRAMATLVPPQGNKEDYHKKLWDHLAIMSDYKLDVDSPYPMERSTEMDTAPKPLERPGQASTNAKKYGQIIPLMIDHIVRMPDSKDKDDLTLLVANQMKKDLVAINRDRVDDRRVFDDLYKISKGRIRLSPEEVALRTYQVPPTQMSKKKKKK